MKAGNAIHRVKFYAKVTDRDIYGASSDTWPIATITTRGEVRYTGGSKILSNEEKFYAKSMELIVRYRSEIVETMKVQIDRRPYSYIITYIEVLGRNESLRLTLEKGQSTWAEEGVLCDGPTGLTATAYSEKRIDLAWTLETCLNEDGISIERSLDDGDEDPYVEIKTVGAGIEYYIDKVKELTTYYYRVRAFKGSVYSDYSNVAFATTPEKP